MITAEHILKSYHINYMPSLIENIHLTEQYRFPRSKKKRIRKKWEKNKKNWGPMRNIIAIGDNILMGHPCVMIELKRQSRKLMNQSEKLHIGSIMPLPDELFFEPIEQKPIKTERETFKWHLDYFFGCSRFKS